MQFFSKEKKGHPMQFFSKEALLTDIETIDSEVRVLQLESEAINDTITSLHVKRAALSEALVIVSEERLGLEPGTLITPRVSDDSVTLVASEIEPRDATVTPPSGDSVTLENEAREGVERLTEVFNHPVDPKTKGEVKSPVGGFNRTPAAKKANTTLDQKVRAVGERDREKTANDSAYSAANLRDTVLTMEGSFTLPELAEKAMVHVTTARKYLNELISSDIVKRLDETRPNTSKTGGRGHVLFAYNTDIPPAPTVHPRQLPPEVAAIGAPIGVRGEVLPNNGHLKVSNKTMQGIIAVAESAGWTVTWKDATHLKFKSPDGRTIGASADPTKHVCLLIKRDLKRSGLRIA